MFESIYDFCKVRNLGRATENTDEPTPRVKFLMELLEKLNIPFELDKFEENGIPLYNIILRGTNDKMIVAHHDVHNHNIDNANDNSASVINAIATKLALPDLNVVLLDAEEMPILGGGSRRVSEQINNGEFNVKWVLNLELTGNGGKYFFIGNYPGPLSDHIKELFDCPVFNTPFNDSIIFRQNGIDSTVINPLPKVENTDSTLLIRHNDYILDFSILFNCHTQKDTIESISVDDMKTFVNEVLLEILK